MSDYAFFYNSENGDRVYDADSFGLWLRKFFTTGVFANDLFVEKDTGMKIKVNTGYCNIDGKVRFFNAIQSFTIEAANGLYPRIDTVVLERNDNESVRNITMKVVNGEPNVTPVATAPVRTDLVYQLVIAEVYVAEDATEITQADITDTRTDPDICGYVTGTVDEIDFSQITAQFEAYFAEFESENLVEFESWFDHMKDQLDSDAAGHLQNEIDNLQGQITTLDGAVTDLQNKVAVRTFTVATTNWEANAGTDATKFPYVANIATTVYSNTFIPAEMLLLGADISDYMTNAELEAKDLVDAQVKFTATAIRLRATAAPASALTLVVRG